MGCHCEACQGRGNLNCQKNRDCFALLAMTIINRDVTKHYADVQYTHCTSHALPIRYAHILSYVCRVSSTLTAYVLLLPTSLLSKTESGVVSLLLKLHLYPNKSQGRFRMYKELNNQALSTPFLEMFPPSKLRLKRDCLNSVSFHPPMLAVLNQIGLAMSSLFFNFSGRLGKKYGDRPKRCRLKGLQRGSQWQKGRFQLLLNCYFFPGQGMSLPAPRKVCLSGGYLFPLNPLS